MDADDVFDRFPARSCLTSAADMILVLIKKMQATTLHIRGRNIEDENGAGHRQGNKPIVGAGHWCRDIRRSVEPERILTVLADKSDGLRTQPSRAGRPIAWTNFAPI